MYFRRIKITRGSRILQFTSYTMMITARRAYWHGICTDRYQQLQTHLEIMHQSEQHLEQLYRLPEGTLRGAHLVFGSIRSMREALTDEYLRFKIKNDLIRFHVHLEADTRNVTVTAEHDGNGNWQIFRVYKIGHNFYGIALIEDPIAPVG